MTQAASSSPTTTTPTARPHRGVAEAAESSLDSDPMMLEGGGDDVTQPKKAMATGKKQRKLPPGFGQIIPTISVEVGGPGCQSQGQFGWGSDYGLGSGVWDWPDHTRHQQRQGGWAGLLSSKVWSGGLGSTRGWDRVCVCVWDWTDHTHHQCQKGGWAKPLVVGGRSGVHSRLGPGCVGVARSHPPAAVRTFGLDLGSHWTGIMV